MDYELEARNSERLRGDLASLTGVSVAAVVPELSSRSVLTTRWVAGEKLCDSRAEDVRELCTTLLNAYLIQLLETGFLHADPHPGNLIRTPDGGICIIDMGLMTQVTEEQRWTILECISHLSTESWEAMTVDLQRLGFVPGWLDPTKAELVDGLAVIMSQLMAGGSAKVNIDKIADDLALMGQKYPFQEALPYPCVEQVPPFFVLILRAFSVIEGIALKVDPDYAIVKECFPYLCRRLLADDSERAKAILRGLLFGRKRHLDVARLTRIADSFGAFTTGGLLPRRAAGGMAGGMAAAGGVSEPAQPVWGGRGEEALGGQPNRAAAAAAASAVSRPRDAAPFAPTTAQPRPLAIGGPEQQPREQRAPGGKAAGLPIAVGGQVLGSWEAAGPPAAARRSKAGFSSFDSMGAASLPPASTSSVAAPIPSTPRRLPTSAPPVSSQAVPSLAVKGGGAAEMAASPTPSTPGRPKLTPASASSHAVRREWAAEMAGTPSSMPTRPVLAPSSQRRPAAPSVTVPSLATTPSPALLPLGSGPDGRGNEDGQLDPVVRDALLAMFGRRGSYVQDLLVQEAVAAVDALSRGALNEVLKSLIGSLPVMVASSTVSALGPLRSLLPLPLPPTPAELLAQLKPALATTPEDVEALRVAAGVLALLQRCALQAASSAAGRPGGGQGGGLLPAARMGRAAAELAPQLAPGLVYMAEAFSRAFVARLVQRLVGRGGAPEDKGAALALASGFAGFAMPAAFAGSGSEAVAAEGRPGAAPLPPTWERAAASPPTRTPIRDWGRS